LHNSEVSSILTPTKFFKKGDSEGIICSPFKSFQLSSFFFDLNDYPLLLPPPPILPFFIHPFSGRKKKIYPETLRIKVGIKKADEKY
jgi:hypothetical protein